MGARTSRWECRGRWPPRSACPGGQPSALSMLGFLMPAEDVSRRLMRPPGVFPAWARTSGRVRIRTAVETGRPGKTHRFRPDEASGLQGTFPSIGGGELRYARGVGAGVLKGRCECSVVEFEVADAFVEAYNCHCSNCRAATGSVFRPWGEIEPEKMKLTRGADSLVVQGDADGRHAVRCKECFSLLHWTGYEGKIRIPFFGSRHRGSGFGPVAVTRRCGTQSSTWLKPSKRPSSSSTTSKKERR